MQHAAVAAVAGQAFARAYQLRRPEARLQGDAAFAHGRRQATTQIMVEAAQRQLAAVGHAHLAAEAAEDAGELRRDIAGTEDQQSPRQPRQFQHLRRVDGQIDAGNAGTRGRAAGGDEDAAGAQALAADAHCVRVLQLGPAGAGAHPGLVQQALIARLEPAGLGVLRRGQTGEVEHRLAQLPAIGRGIGKGLRELRAVHEDLLRHAAAQHAGAAEPVGFADRDPGALGRRVAAGRHAAGAGADGDQVEIVAGHNCSLGKAHHRRNALTAWP